MDRLMIDIALIIVALGIGYWTGFRAGVEYLCEELENYKKDHR